MGAEFQREDGRVHHCFKPDMKCSDNGFARVDINMQFVLMVLRDYLFTGDKDYLLSLWDNVKKAMDSTGLLDTDNDGLPDYDTKRNTYDAWNFSGTPVYISVLWLAALKAAVLIADRVGDKSRSDQWSNILLNGKKICLKAKDYFRGGSNCVVPAAFLYCGYDRTFGKTVEKHFFLHFLPPKNKKDAQSPIVPWVCTSPKLCILILHQIFILVKGFICEFLQNPRG